MANEEHLNILKQGAQKWNEWRADNRYSVEPDLRQATLREADLSGAMLSKANLIEADLNRAHMHRTLLPNSYLSNADLSEADLEEADLEEADLHWANVRKANLREANLHWSSLFEADLREANLSGADLGEADLTRADLREANLSGADLRGTDLREANLSGADLREADLQGAVLIRTDLVRANLSGCHVFGISAWGLKLEGAIQTDLVITGEDERAVTVDNLEVAQFIYLLLHNKKIREVIDTITSKVVLILGRFTPERKAVLDTLRDELRKRNYTPILFDFDKPSNRDLTETVMTLAGMARFVIADLSDPNSSPHEVMSFAEKLPSVPVQAIFCPVPEHKNPYPMYDDHFRRYRHILPIYTYETQQKLVDALYEKVIRPAEAKVDEMRPAKL